METNADADAPRPETTEETPEPPALALEAEAEDAPSEAVPEVADELSEIVATAEQGRLSAAQEERATALLKEALMGGRAGVARVVATLPRLPWLVGIRAVETVWPELTAGFRTQLLSGLSKEETDAARRMRLSLARALFKIDPPVGLKIAVGVAKEMRDKETGAVTARDAQMFSNVFIGRARPWIALLPLEEIKPTEADLLIHIGALVAFSMPHPPVTQLGVLKWVQANGRLDKLEEPAQAAVLAGVARWSAKWQNALRREVPEVPETILAVLKPEAPDTPEAAENGADDAGEPVTTDEATAGEEVAEPAPKKARPVYISRQEEARRKAILEAGGDPDAEEPVALVETDEDGEEDEAEETDEETGEPCTERGPRDYREPREPRAERGRHGSFNVSQALRQIESHINALRSELESTKTKLRNRDKDAQRMRKPDVPVIEGEPTPEELARLNHQLGLRNTELQERIAELTQHAEDLAAASGAIADQPVAEPDSQLRALLALKLQEDYADFLALEKEGNDIVVQQHYRTLISHLFEVLLAQGVPLKAEEG